MDLFQMSLAASPLILAVTLLRLLLLNQLPKRTFKILWLITLLRLLLPYTIPSPFSIYNLFSLTQSPLRMPLPLQILWLLGALGIAVFFLRTHIQTRKRFIGSSPIEHTNLTLWFQANTIRRPMRIRFSRQIRGPLTYGIFRPVILLPQDTNLDNEMQLRFILTHEYIHLCRFDALIKAVLALVLCLHWFNPLVWVLFFLANRDIELTCDEGVLRTLGYSQRAAYAFLLINMTDSQRRPSSTLNQFSNNALEERIIAIMKMKKKPLISVVFAFLLASVIVLIFATSAVTPVSSVRIAHYFVKRIF